MKVSQNKLEHSEEQIKTNRSVVTNITVIITSGTCCSRIQFDGAEKCNLPLSPSGAFIVGCDTTVDKVSADFYGLYRY